MYHELAGKKSIQPWCYTHVTTTKIQKEISKDVSASSEGQKSDVDAVYEQLRQKHNLTMKSVFECGPIWTNMPL